MKKTNNKVSNIGKCINQTFTEKAKHDNEIKEGKIDTENVFLLPSTLAVLLKRVFKVDILERFKYAFNTFNGFFISPRLSAFYQKPFSWFINRTIFFHVLLLFFLFFPCFFSSVSFSSGWNFDIPIAELQNEREKKMNIRRFIVTHFVHVELPLSIIRTIPWIIIYCNANAS